MLLIRTLPSIHHQTLRCISAISIKLLTIEFETVSSIEFLFIFLSKEKIKSFRHLAFTPGEVGTHQFTETKSFQFFFTKSALPQYPGHFAIEFTLL